MFWILNNGITLLVEAEKSVTIKIIVMMMASIWFIYADRQGGGKNPPMLEAALGPLLLWTMS